MDLYPLLKYGYFLALLVNGISSDDPACQSNIKSCYNCMVEGNCLVNDYYNTTEEECLNYLTSQQVVWSVEYDNSTSYCRESNCEDIKVYYQHGKVIHRKTCDTNDCADYTITVHEYTNVSATENIALYEDGRKEFECLNHFMYMNTSGTIAYASSEEKCILYTECQDTCALVAVSAFWRVFKKSCGYIATTQNATTQAPTTTSETTTSPTTTSQTTTLPTTTSQTTTLPTTTSQTTTLPTTTSQTTTSPTTTSETTTSPTTTSLTTLSQTTTLQSTSSFITATKLYILPCICYRNKTFINMTQEEIIEELIKDTKIDTKNTALAQSKLKCRNGDTRTSSTVIGTISLVLMCTIAGLTMCCDLITVVHKWKINKL